MRIMNYTDFIKYYGNTSTYSKKKEICKDFQTAFIDITANGIENFSVQGFKKVFNTDLKKKIKVRLIIKGYSDQAINSFHRSLNTYVSNL